MKNQPRCCRNLFVCTEINVRPDLYLMIYYMMFTVSVISDDIYLGLLQKKKAVYSAKSFPGCFYALKLSLSPEHLQSVELRAHFKFMSH